MVLLRNDGPQPLLFSVTHDLPAAGLGGELRRRSDDDETAAAAAQQLLEVRPVRGVVPPCQDVQLQVRRGSGEVKSDVPCAAPDRAEPWRCGLVGRPAVHVAATTIGHIGRLWQPTVARPDCASFGHFPPPRRCTSRAMSGRCAARCTTRACGTACASAAS